MTVAIAANPGQTVLIAQQILDGYGQRVDGYVPDVDFVITPAGAQVSGYPESMIRLSEGLYYAAIVVPSGLASVGTYIASISWSDPETGYTQSEVFLINAALPFGNATVSPA